MVLDSASDVGEFVVGSRSWSERFFSGYSGFPLSPVKPTFLNSNSIWTQWTKSHLVDVPLLILIFNRLKSTVTRAIFSCKLQHNTDNISRQVAEYGVTRCERSHNFLRSRSLVYFSSKLTFLTTQNLAERATGKKTSRLCFLTFQRNCLTMLWSLFRCKENSSINVIITNCSQTH